MRLPSCAWLVTSPHYRVFRCGRRVHAAGSVSATNTPSWTYPHPQGFPDEPRCAETHLPAMGFVCMNVLLPTWADWRRSPWSFQPPCRTRGTHLASAPTPWFRTTSPAFAQSTSWACCIPLPDRIRWVSALVDQENKFSWTDGSVPRSAFIPFEVFPSLIAVPHHYGRCLLDVTRTTRVLRHERPGLTCADTSRCPSPVKRICSCCFEQLDTRTTMS